MTEWLDHRKYHNKIHEEKLRLNKKKALERLEEKRKESEKLKNDWVYQKTHKLNDFFEKHYKNY